MKRKRISPEQDAFILENFNKMTKRAIGAAIGLPENTVHQRYRDLMHRKREWSNGIRLSQAYSEPSLPRLRFLENP